MFSMSSTPLDEADAADEELVAVVLDHLRPHVDVAAADGLVDLGQPDAVGAELVGVDVDLVLLDEAADAGDLGDALDGLELVADVPVLERRSWPRSAPSASSVYQKTWPSAVASGPSTGATPCGQPLPRRRSSAPARATAPSSSRPRRGR